MRQAPGFTADSSVYGNQGHYAAKGSAQLETVVVPAQSSYSLSSFGRGPRFVWSGEGCPRGQRLVCVGPELQDRYCDWGGSCTGAARR